MTESADELRLRLSLYRALKNRAQALREILAARRDEMFFPGAKRKVDK